MGPMGADVKPLVREVVSEWEWRCVPVQAIPFLLSWTDPAVAWTCSQERAVETVAEIYHRDHHGWMLAAVMICETGSER